VRHSIRQPAISLMLSVLMRERNFQLAGTRNVGGAP
jgi:hypothetical protein